MDPQKTGAVRLGIAGAGIAALQILADVEHLAGKIVIMAAADIRRENAEYFARATKQDVAIFESVDDMYASGLIDAVWIATPNKLHAETVFSAMATVPTIARGRFGAGLHDTNRKEFRRKNLSDVMNAIHTARRAAGALACLTSRNTKTTPGRRTARSCGRSRANTI